MDRFQLLDWLNPHCEPAAVSLFYPKGNRGFAPGWAYGEPDVQRALGAYRLGRLANERFESTTKDGKPYKIRGAERLGLVPHRDGMVTIFCVDLDDHEGDGGNVHLSAQLRGFLGAEPIVFTSKGGRGLHCFFQLATPMPVEAFVAWAKAWGFNREKQPEVFPKTAKQTQVWLPNEPNGNGGDAYRSGTFDSCVVDTLPTAPPVKLSNMTLDFLRGFVGNGSRNERLNKAAYELGQKRVREVEARRLCVAGAERCGLATDDPSAVETTFTSGYSAGSATQPRADAPTQFFSLDGVGNAMRFTAKYGERVRYCIALKRWFAWNGNHWTSEAEHIVQEWAKRTARRIRQEAADAVEFAEREGRDADERSRLRNAYLRHIRYTCSWRGIQEMLSLAQSDPNVSTTLDWFDRAPLLLNVRNGTIDLQTGELRPHRRRDALTKILKVRYAPNATCPLWLAFLDRIFAGDRELIDYIHRAVGYSLTGAISEQCLFFLFGNGANGKSVFVQTLLYILGDYGQKAPTEMLMKQDRTSNGASPELARLHGIRLAVTAELDEGKQFGESRVKDLTSVDRIVARPLYCKPIEFDPTHKLWMYGNHRPTIRGVDDGIWRRIRLIPFRVTIPEGERDKQLMAKLEAEAEGILAWAVRGCLAWQREGLAAPPAVTMATSEYRQDSNRLQTFIDECCVLAPEAWVAKGAFFDAYETWARSGGEAPWSKRKVGDALLRLGFQEGRTGTSRFWNGIGLMTAQGGEQ